MNSNFQDKEGYELTKLINLEILKYSFLNNMNNMNNEYLYILSPVQQ